ncbi:MAG: hypothetical protein L6U16_10240 [Porphyromonadaceae bacterium]|nr:MAG: hypothetical protein L6U16_10240 [Porphyromonadaceae bacterium]
MPKQITPQRRGRTLSACFSRNRQCFNASPNMPKAKALKKTINIVNEVKDFVEACSRWKRLIIVNSMQANEAPQERMSAAWRLH